MATRLVVWNIAGYITEKRLKEVFERKGVVTDVKVVRTKEGKSREFAFVGFKTPSDAANALAFFNNSYLDTRRITVENAKAMGDSSIKRPWSRYSSGSSAFELSLRQDEPPPKRQKTSSTPQPTEDPSSDRELQEFLHLASHSKSRLWADDSVAQMDRSRPSKDSKAKDSKDKDFRDRDPKAKTRVVSSKESKAMMEDGSKAKVLSQSVPSRKTGGSNLLLRRTHITFLDDGDDDSLYDSLPSFHNDDDDLPSSLPPPDPLPLPSSSPSPDLSLAKHKKDKHTKDKKDITKKKEEEEEEQEKEDEMPPSEDVSDLDWLRSKQLPLSTLPPSPPPSHQTFSDDEEDMQDKPKEEIKPKEPAAPFIHPSRRGAVALEGERRTADRGEDIKEDHEMKMIKSGRLYVTNLPYSTSPSELSALFSRFGELSEVHIPTNKETGLGKGQGFVQFREASRAVEGQGEMDGKVFQGRVLHVSSARPLPARTPSASASPASYKKQKEKEQQKGGSEAAWNALFLRADTVADRMAQKYDLSKGSLLDSHSSSSLAVRLALGETHIIGETKDCLRAEGVDLDQLGRHLEEKVERSDTVLLVKNLPFETSLSDLRSLFAKYGPLGRIVLPPSRALALVEFLQANDAKRAFRHLSFRKFLHVPLYLEWTPSSLFSSPFSPSSSDSPALSVHDPVVPETAVAVAVAVAVGEVKEERETERDREESSTVFVKNLSFDTSQDALQRFVEDELRAKGETRRTVRSVRVATKKGPKGNLSLGYGFIELSSPDLASKTLKLLQGKSLDGHSLVLEFSKTPSSLASSSSSSSNKKKKAVPLPDKPLSAKLLVRNLAFEAKKAEIRELFSTFGQIKRVTLPRKADGNSRGFCFVEYVSKDEAKKAMESLRHTHLYGRHLVLEYATKDEKSIEELRQEALDVIE